MKVELLQSISVAVLSVGLFLSALGAFGTYYFGGKSERKTTTVEMTEPDLPIRDDAADRRLASIVEPVIEAVVAPPPPVPAPAPPAPTPIPPPAPQQKPTTVIADLNVKPPAPVAEKLVAAKPEETPVAPPSRIMPEPEPEAVPAKKTEPPVPAKTIATKSAPADSKLARLEALGIEPWQMEKMQQRLRTFDHGTITIQAPAGSDEASRLAGALKEAFVAAGWRVIGVNVVKAGTDPKGITLSSGSFPPPAEVTTIFSALVTAGLKLSTDLDPSMGKQHAVLFVGSRR